MGFLLDFKMGRGWDVYENVSVKFVGRVGKIQGLKINTCRPRVWSSGRQAFISSGRKEPRSALESRRVSLGAHWVDSRESSLLRRLERGREIGR